MQAHRRESQARVNNSLQDGRPLASAQSGRTTLRNATRTQNATIVAMGYDHMRSHKHRDLDRRCRRLVSIMLIISPAFSFRRVFEPETDRTTSNGFAVRRPRIDYEPHMQSIREILSKHEYSIRNSDERFGPLR